MSRPWMLGRLVFRSFLVRPGRAVTAVAAVAVGAGIVSALLLLYSDVQSKLHEQFRSYGANVIVTAPEGGALPPDALTAVKQQLGPAGIAAPFGFAAATTADGRPVVVAGTDFDLARRLNPYWSLSVWPGAPNQCVLGGRVLLPDEKAFDLFYNGARLTLTPVASLHTGSDDDLRIYISLADFSRWTGRPASTIEVYAPGSAAQVGDFVQRLQGHLPQAAVRPVRQIVEAEGRILEKTRGILYATALVIALTAVLTILTTLTASLLDRRRDFALMKALGATQHRTELLFVVESGLLGAIGGMIGYGIGLAAAEAIAWNSFHFHLSARLEILPLVVAGSILVTLGTALLPLRMLRQFQPAGILKGE